MTTIIIVLFATMFMVALLLGRSKTSDEYFSNFGKTNTSTIFLSLLASLIGGWMFFGLTQIGYESGFAGVAIGVGYSIGLIFFVIKADKVIEITRSTHSHNLLDVFRSIYGNRVYNVAAVINVCFFLGVLCAQFIALKTLFSSVPTVDADISFWVTAALVILYTALGGFKSVLVTDKYQMIGIAILISLIAVMYSQDISLIATLPPEQIHGTGYGIAFLIAAIVIFPFTIFCRADLWQRAASATSPRSFKLALLIALPFLLITYVLFTLYGMIASANELEPIPNLLNDISQFLGGEVGGIVFVFGIGCALVSTIDTNANVLSRIFSNCLNNKNADSVTLSRYLSLAVGIVSLVIAEYFSNIVDVIVSVGAIILVMFPASYCLIRTRNGHEPQKFEIPAFWSMLLGLVAVVVSAILLDPKSAFIVGFIFSYVVWFFAILAVNKKA